MLEVGLGGMTDEEVSKITVRERLVDAILTTT